MREQDAIKNCVSKSCHSMTNDLYTSYEIDKWLQRRKIHQHSAMEANLEQRRRRVHRGFVLERRKNPISGMRAYWRPLKGDETRAAARTRNANRKVSIAWRKSESQGSDSSGQCPVWQCYQRPAVKKATTLGKDAKSPADEKEKEKEEVKEEDRTRTEARKRSDIINHKPVKAENPRSQIRRIEKPKSIQPKQIQNSATQTVEENLSNVSKKESDNIVSPEEVKEPPSTDANVEEKEIEDIDIREYMKGDKDKTAGPSEEEKFVTTMMQQLKKEEIKEREKERRRKERQHVDRGTRFARTFTIPIRQLKERASIEKGTESLVGSPKKCPTCGHEMPQSVSSSSDESSVSEDDSRLDPLAQNVRWAVERRAAIQKLFLLENDDLLGPM